MSRQGEVEGRAPSIARGEYGNTLRRELGRVAMGLSARRITSLEAERTLVDTALAVTRRYASVLEPNGTAMPPDVVDELMGVAIRESAGIDIARDPCAVCERLSLIRCSSWRARPWGEPWA